MLDDQVHSWITSPSRNLKSSRSWSLGSKFGIIKDSLERVFPGRESIFFYHLVSLWEGMCVTSNSMNFFRSRQRSDASWLKSQTRVREEVAHYVMKPYKEDVNDVGERLVRRLDFSRDLMSFTSSTC